MQKNKTITGLQRFRVSNFRNQTENRLKNKASKRNLAFSEQNLLNSDEKYRMESFENEACKKYDFKVQSHL